MKRPRLAALFGPKYALAIALCLPGALFVGGWGLLMTGFGVSLGSYGIIENCCLLFYGVFGGASLGATPGLLLACYQGGSKWACPFLGAAAGTLIGASAAFACEALSVAAPSYGRHLLAALMPIGFIVGCWPFYRNFSCARGALRNHP